MGLQEGCSNLETDTSLTLTSSSDNSFYHFSRLNPQLPPDFLFPSSCLLLHHASFSVLINLPKKRILPSSYCCSLSWSPLLPNSIPKGSLSPGIRPACWQLPAAQASATPPLSTITDWSVGGLTWGNGWPSRVISQIAQEQEESEDMSKWSTKKCETHEHKSGGVSRRCAQKTQIPGGKKESSYQDSAT